MPRRAHTVPVESTDRFGADLSAVVLDTGFISASATTFFDDGRKDWTPDIWFGFIILILSGPAAGNRRAILSNTANRIVPETVFSSAPDVGDQYIIIPGPIQARVRANVELRGASGNLAAGEEAPALGAVGWAKLVIVRLNVTVLTLPDGDDEVDFYLQTHYGDANWTDIENIHFANADDGNTSVRIMIVSEPKSSAVARTESDGTLADDTKLDLPMGSELRFRTAVTGATAPTYAYSAVAKLIG